MKRFFPILLVATLLAPALHAAELVVYTERKEPLVKPIFDRYTRETGTTVRILSDGAPVLIERLAAEGANTRADLFMSAACHRLPNAGCWRRCRRRRSTRRCRRTCATRRAAGSRCRSAPARSCTRPSA